MAKKHCLLILRVWKMVYASEDPAAFRHQASPPATTVITYFRVYDFLSFRSKILLFFVSFCSLNDLKAH